MNPSLTLMPKNLSGNLQQILKETSRAFYLSLAILPPLTRRSLSLAYLLARAADTVADSEARIEALRTQTLKRMQVALLEASDLKDLQLENFCPSHQGEKRLLAYFPELIEELQITAPAQRDEIITVVHTLIEGMLLDQEFFVTGREHQRGLNAEELERYTYLVAGCVGPFWSSICAGADPQLAGLKEPSNIDLAVEFGKALQWVNILRDIPKDQSFARYYLPEMTAEQFSSRLAQTALRALTAFESAIAYPSLYPESYWRNRIAVFLPLVLGLRTLELLFRAGGPRPNMRIKVRRFEVFCWLVIGAFCVTSDRGQDFVFKQLLKRAYAALDKMESSHV